MIRFFNQNSKQNPRKGIGLVMLLSIILMLSTACEDCTFISKNSTLIKLRFYRQGTTRQAKFNIDSVRTERGTVYKRGSIDIDTLSLPINPTSTNNAYYVFFRKVSINNVIVQRRDTLQVAYDRLFSVVAPNCGYDQRVDNLLILPEKTSRQILQTAQIFKNNLTVNDSVNIRIFF